MGMITRAIVGRWSCGAGNRGRMFELQGDPELPGGRFVSGVTMGIRYIGVCIPWQSAHVSTGRKDRKSWEDHLIYCRGLTRIIEKYRKQDFPVCVLGGLQPTDPKGQATR